MKPTNGWIEFLLTEWLLLASAAALAASVFVRTEKGVAPRMMDRPVTANRYIYAGLLVIVALTVLRVLPLAFGVLVLVYALIFDRKAMRVDYGLLLTFLCFFGLTENIKPLLNVDIEHSRHIFLFSALLSQIMSNVSATLLFAKFTTQWKALLWGANVGGFGNLVSSFANLIAYKFYIGQANRYEIMPFTIRFVGLGYVMFFAGLGLYLALETWP